MTWIDLLLGIVASLLWGFNFISAKIGLTYFSPLFFTALRLLLVSIILIPFNLTPPTSWNNILTLSFVLGILHFGILFYGLSGLDVSTAAIALQLGVPFTSLLGIFIYHEKVTWKGWFGLLLAILGVIIVAFEPHRPSLYYLSLVIIAAFFWSLSNILIKKINTSQQISLNAWVSFLSGIELLILSMIFEKNHFHSLLSSPLSAYVAIAYTAIASTIIAYSLWYRLMTKYDLSKIAPISLLNPIIGIISSGYYLGEDLTWRKIIGAVITLSGVALIMFASSSTKKIVKNV
jgi:O-acetylserine/cysteine efflux transporter